MYFFIYLWYSYIIMKRIYKKHIPIKNNELILYTVRNQKEIDLLFKNNVLKPNNKHIKKFHQDWPFFLDSYRWINKKCKESLTNYNQEFPLWAWVKRPNANSVKCEYNGEPFYIIKFKISKDNCLISDFERWHFVLNDIYLPKNLNTISNYMNHASFFSKNGSLKDQEKVLKSWDRVFQLDSNKLQQACFAFLSLNDILEIKRYN
jgi:hypothetical protein